MFVHFEPEGMVYTLALKCVEEPLSGRNLCKKSVNRA